MDNFDKKTNSTFIIGENKIDKTFTPEEIWNALCKVIRGASGEAVDGIIILCEEILDVPAPQIEKKLYSDGVIDDLYYGNYDEYDIIIQHFITSLILYIVQITLDNTIYSI